MGGPNKVRTLPHALTLARLPLAVVVWLHDAPWFVLGIMILAAITDVLDGRFARWQRKKRGEPIAGGPTDLGAWLDPLCDKVFVLSALAAVWYVRRPAIYWMFLVASRELILTAVALAHRLSRRVKRRLRFDMRAAIVGKLATVVQFIAVGAILFGSPAASSWVQAAGLIGVGAAAYYVGRARGSAHASEEASG